MRGAPRQSSRMGSTRRETPRPSPASPAGTPGVRGPGGRVRSRRLSPGGRLSANKGPLLPRPHRPAFSSPPAPCWHAALAPNPLACSDGSAPRTRSGAASSSALSTREPWQSALRLGSPLRPPRTLRPPGPPHSLWGNPQPDVHAPQGSCVHPLLLPREDRVGVERTCDCPLPGSRVPGVLHAAQEGEVADGVWGKGAGQR